ncbi:protein BTG3 [Salarias fasciatus]|uniref:Anti-proliferative protein domain-containing protein n=1 Tax=Salarias fasciatus TaxID=181472 RepID=A0A672GUW6_SALFA|nr:protein BTG3 [Salarias fasciatus]XP_029957515.1 protein BTG3 [Salarias fasciatus]
MRREIAAVVFFLKRLVKKRERLDSDKIELFVERLAVALQEKFKGHWYPETPSRGQAYRCIRVNGFYRQDPELLRACRESGVQYRDLGLPREFTLWVDPGEVCCRYGEQNPCFSVATFSSEDEDDKDVAKNVTSALERVTSDYHSGSSSDEESARTSPLTVPNRHSAYQFQMNPAAPSWHPKNMAPFKCPNPPRPHYSYRYRGRAPNIHNAWVPPAHRAGPGYWDTNQNPTH